MQPLSLTFSSDADTPYLTAEDGGRRKLFQIPVPPASDEQAEEEATLAAAPSPLTSWGSVSSVHAVSPTLLLLTSSSLTSSSVFITANPRTGIAHELSRNTDYSSSHFAQRYPQVSDIQFPGAGPYDVHAFVVKLSSLSADDQTQKEKEKKKEKKYPLLFRIHSGPRDPFLDERSTRWNPAVFAESRLRRRPPEPDRFYGLRAGLRRRRQRRPDRDLVRYFDHVRAKLDYADTDHAVATGYSYGGYTMNWIAGPPAFAARSRALVRHARIFGLTTLLSSNGTGRLAPRGSGPPEGGGGRSWS